MKKTIISAVLFALTIAANAQRNNNYSSQPYDNRQGGVVYGNPRVESYNNFTVIDQLQRDAQYKINTGIERGLITRNEARNLVRKLDYLNDKKYRFERNGRFSLRERDELMADFRDLNFVIDREIHDFEQNRYARNGVRRF